MQVLLLVAMILPQDYINLLLNDDYAKAISYCEEMIGKTSGSDWRMELADVYFSKLEDLAKAEDIYRGILKDFQQKNGWVHYRLALVLEMKEDYLSAAKEYEVVATRFRQPPLDSFALVGVERCFKKNYQDYVATVDGYNITRLELDEKVSGSAQYAKKKERDILDQMITERLLYVNALKNNVKEMDVYKTTIGQARKSLLLDELRAVDIVAKAVPTETEMRQYYNRNKETYKMHSEIKGREIIVESESLAKFIHDSLTKDIGSFDTLAKLYSTAPTRGSGGNMGGVSPGVKPKEVEKVIFKSPLNKLSEIVKFDNKFGIYTVVGRKEERYRTFKEARSQVEPAARAEKTTKLEEKLVAQLKAKATIEIKKENLAVDSATGPEDKVVAILNGRPILRSAVEKRNAMQPTFVQVDLSKPEEFEKILNTVIEENLKLEYIEQKKYYLNEGFFAKYLEAMKRALDQGLYTKIVIDPVKVDSQEIMDHYTTRKEDFKVSESVKGREIVVYSQSIAQKAYDELVMLYGRKSCLIPFLSKEAKITDYARFDSIAKEYSVSVTKERGGDIGLLRRGGRPKPYEDVAFTLKPGAISKPFLVGDSSWTIFTVVEYTPVTYRKYDDVKAAIETNLRREKQRKIVDDFLAKIKQEADIKIMLPEVEKEGTEEGTGIPESGEGKPTDIQKE